MFLFLRGTHHHNRGRARALGKSLSKADSGTDGPLGRTELLLVAILFLGLTVAFFLPLVLGMGTSLLEPSFGGRLVAEQSRDKYHFIWNFWWLRSALSSGLDVLHTQMIFHPEGASLVLQTMDYLDGALAAPLTSLFGEIFSYNTVVLASFPLAGLTSFLLAWHLTRSRLASVIGGLIFAFFPQHVAQALFAHPNIANVAWIPAYFLCLMLAFERGSARYAVASGAFLAVLTLVDLEMLVMAAMGTVVYLGYQLTASRFSNPRKFLALALLVAVVGIGATSPYLFAAYHAAASQSRLPPPITAAVRASAHPALYLTPVPYNALYGAAFAPSYSGLAGGPANWMVFTGWTVAALAAVGAVAASDRRKYFLIALASVSFLFSLGPSLDPSAVSAQSPYTFLYDNVPILHYFRATSRLSIMLMLGLSNLAAMGAVKVMKAVEGTCAPGFPAAKLVACLITALILVEYAPSVTAGPVPQSGVYGIIARDGSTFAVLELPTTITQTQISLYEQTLHGKPLVNGKTSQSSHTLPAYVSSAQFLRSLVDPRESPKLRVDVVNQSFSEAQLAPIVMTMYGIKYIVAHAQAYPDPRTYHAVFTKLMRALGPPVYQDNATALFELGHWTNTSSVLRMIKTSPLVVFGDGWGPREAGGRNVSSNAQMFVFVSNSGYYDFRLKLSSPVCLSANSTASSVCGVPDGATGLSSYRLHLAAGRNVVSLAAAARDPTISYIQVAPDKGNSTGTPGG
jgi:hypothetical protein